MPDYPVPLNEEERLAVLHEYDVLDLAAEQAYDDIVRLASTICGTPIALVTLIDGDTQWFKATVGIRGRSTPREHAFCAHAIMGRETMVVPDATQDARFADNPMVREDPRIRFYAGAPLSTLRGHNLGTLCVVDTKPRSLTPEQLDALEALGRLVVGQLELRRTSKHLSEALARVKTLRGLLPICAYCKRIRDDRDYWREVEGYIRSHAPVEFSHSVCPTCVEKHFPEL